MVIKMKVVIEEECVILEKIIKKYRKDNPDASIEDIQKHVKEEMIKKINKDNIEIHFFIDPNHLNYVVW